MSKDTTYNLEGVSPWTIHHRGTDNFLAVLDWLQKNGREQYGIDFKRARDVTVTGASAGGYGANLAFAYVAELTREKPRLNLISDSAIGVINEQFYTTGIYNPADHGSANWGVLNNLPSWVPGMDEGWLAQGVNYPKGFVPSTFALLSNYKPKAKLASLTSNLELVQIFFYGLMQGVVPPDEAAFNSLNLWPCLMIQQSYSTVASRVGSSPSRITDGGVFLPGAHCVITSVSIDKLALVKHQLVGTSRKVGLD